MKFIRRTACLLLVALGAATAWPAEAAGPYNIKGTGTGVSFASGSWTMTAARGPACNPTVLLHPGQGVDSYTVDVSGMAGRLVALDWSAEVDQGRLETRIFNGTCDIAIINGQPTFSENPGRFVFVLPAEARYLVVAPNLAYNVKFTLNIIG